MIDIVSDRLDVFLDLQYNKVMLPRSEKAKTKLYMILTKFF